MLAVLVLTIKDQDWGGLRRKESQMWARKLWLWIRSPRSLQAQQRGRVKREMDPAERDYWQLRGQAQRQTGSWGDAQRVATLFSTKPQGQKTPN